MGFTHAIKSKPSCIVPLFCHLSTSIHLFEHPRVCVKFHVKAYPLITWSSFKVSISTVCSNFCQQPTPFAQDNHARYARVIITRTRIHSVNLKPFVERLFGGKCWVFLDLSIWSCGTTPKSFWHSGHRELLLNQCKMQSKWNTCPHSKVDMMKIGGLPSVLFSLSSVGSKHIAHVFSSSDEILLESGGTMLFPSEKRQSLFRGVFFAPRRRPKVHG